MIIHRHLIICLILIINKHRISVELLADDKKLYLKPKTKKFFFEQNLSKESTNQASAITGRCLI